MTKKSITSKYKNKKVEYEGIVFDSQMERDYYINLRKLFNKDDIKIQPKFVLQESFRDKNDKLIREISYTADFQVFNQVYDVKGMMTQQGGMRLKMFKYKYRTLNLLAVTKAPKWTGREWIEIDELKRLRKNRKMCSNM